MSELALATVILLAKTELANNKIMKILATKGKSFTIEWLYLKGADLHFNDDEALHLVIINNHLDTVKSILNIDENKKVLAKAMFFSIKEDNVEILKFILEYYDYMPRINIYFPELYRACVEKAAVKCMNYFKTIAKQEKIPINDEDYKPKIKNSPIKVTTSPVKVHTSPDKIVASPVKTKYTLDFIFQYSAADLDAFISQFTDKKYPNLNDKRYMAMYYLYDNYLLDKETEDLLVNNSDKFRQVLEISHSAQELRRQMY